MDRTLVALLVLAVPLAVAGCSGEEVGRSAGTLGVVYCGSPLADHEVEQVEYRQDGEVVASVEVPTGTVFRADVPIGPATDVYADGRLAGGSGDDAGGTVTGGYVALLGEGCPPYEAPRPGGPVDPRRPSASLARAGTGPRTS